MMSAAGPLQGAKAPSGGSEAHAVASVGANTPRPFKVLGIQQIAIGGPDKTRLQKLWVDMFGLEVTGTFKSDTPAGIGATAEDLGRVTGNESWFRKMKRAVGFKIENSEGAPPTARRHRPRPLLASSTAKT